MNEIINLDERRLSKMSNDELLVEAIEKASKHILEQGRLIRKIISRLESVEDKIK